MSTHTVDVAVVGAGLAGLCAATALVDAGLDVVVIEARDRVGGRTLSKQLSDGTVIDLGGQWAGPTHTALLGLAEELGCATFPTYDVGDHLDIVNKLARRFAGPIPDSDPLGLADLGAAYAAFDALCETIDLNAPWLSPDALTLDSMTFSSWLDKTVQTPTARERLATVTRAVWAAEPADLSLLHALFYARSNGGLGQLTATTGGAQEHRFHAGAQSISIGLADRLGDRVRLREPVWTVAHGPWGVELAGAGLPVRATHAVIAIPPTLAGHLRYEPALPPQRTQLTQRTPMGSVIKVLCSYPTPFWRSQGYPVSCSVTPDRCGLRSTTAPNGDVGVLLGFIEGADARIWMARTRDERQVAVINNFVTYFGPAAGQPNEYQEMSWAAEPYSGGCYATYLPPGVWTSFGASLRDPIGPLHWAGADIAVHSAGYMDGAIRSGRAAAAAVLFERL